MPGINTITKLTLIADFQVSVNSYDEERLPVRVQQRPVDELHVLVDVDVGPGDLMLLVRDRVSRK